jgi:5'-nucleotidase / UDP-sugar diphosphatase
VKVFKTLLIMLLLFNTSQLWAYQPGKTYKITVLHTSDHHGHFNKNRYGEGGLAAQMTLINKIRREVFEKKGITLVFSSGDINTGTPASDFFEAEPDFMAMKLIGFDGMAVGNHEFDNSLSIILKQQKTGSFPFLSANILSNKDNALPFKNFIIKEFSGLKIGIFGLTTDDTPMICQPENIKELIFHSPIETAGKLVPILKKKSDIIFSITHLGYYKDGKHGNNAPGDVTLARTVKGIDAIFGGHTHDAFKEVVYENETAIIHSGDTSRYISRSDFEFSDGELSLKNYKLIPVNLKKKVIINNKKVRKFIEHEIREDSKLLTLLSPFLEQGKKELEQEVGIAHDFIDGRRKSIRFRKTTMGNLFTIAIKKMVNADAAIINSGGIRDSFEKGIIRYSDLLRVHPFNNTICKVSLTGMEVKKYLGEVVKFNPGEGSFPQMSGIKLTVKDKKISIKINGKPVEDNKIYTLALNNYITSGGDRYPLLSNHPGHVNTGYTLVSALKKLITEKKIIKASDFDNYF